MTYSMWNWRRSAFFALDRVRGSRYQRHLDDLAAYFANPDAHASTVQSRLHALLEHATATTEAYRPYQGSTDLCDFPVITKSQIALNRSAFISSAYDPRRLPTTTTSGSYGTPFTFLQTREKWERQRAEIIYFSRWAGFEIGERHAFGLMVGAEKSRLTRFLQNEVWLDPMILCEERLAGHCERLIRERIQSCVVNPSYMRALARHSMAAGIRPSSYTLRGASAIAEMLEESTRQLVQTAFGCRFLSRYATAELSVLAQECPDRHVHHLNLASHSIELLAVDRDQPALPGEVGRVVVTDTFSHAMPLIRYETGDLAVAGQQCDCGIPGPVLSQLMGRTFDMIYDTNDEPIYSMAIIVLMTDIEHLVQFQFVQRGPADYVLRLRVLPGFSSEHLARERLRSLVGDGARMAVEYVDDIPPLVSGKRPSVVNVWHGQPRFHTV